MTELNPPTDDSPDSPDTRVDWPADAGDAAVDGSAGGDAAIAALLVRLDSLPGLPVESHGEVYAGLHDELAAALNEDVAGLSAGDSLR